MKKNNTKQSSKQPAGFRRFWPVALAVMAVLSFSAWTPVALAFEEEEIPFDVADIYFELNHTDGDLGIHALIDGDAWKYLAMEDPRGRKMLNIFVRGRLHRQGLTELFFESAEPTFDELDPEKFFRRFPEGAYEIEGITLDREALESTDYLTHLLPAPPEGIVISGESVDLDEADCEEGPAAVVDAQEITISWDEVTLSHPDLGRTNEPIEVVGYQLVVEEDESELVFSLHLPPEVTSATIPPEFIALGSAFKFEILVREVSGNQTAIESCFEVEK
jgi:hypothetical protein